MTSYDFTLDALTSYHYSVALVRYRLHELLQQNQYLFIHRHMIIVQKRVVDTLRQHTRAYTSLFLLPSESSARTRVEVHTRGRPGRGGRVR